MKYLWSRRLSRFKFIFYLAVTVCFCSFGWFANRSDKSVALADRIIDFGNIYEQDAFEFSIDLTNSTASPLIVTGIETSCRSCTNVSPTQFTIAKGESRCLKTELNLRSISRQFEDFSGVRFSTTLVPKLQGDGLRVRPITLTGIVRPLLLEKGRELNLDKTLIHGDLDQMCSLIVSPAPEVSSLSVTALSGVIENCKSAKNLDSSFTVSMTLHRGVKPGVHTIPLTFHFEMLDSTATSQTVLNLSIEILPRLTIDPVLPLDFGARKVGSTIDGVLVCRLRNNGKFKLSLGDEEALNGILIDNSDLAIEHLIKLEHFVEKLGNTDRVIRIIISDEGGTVVEETLDYTLFGIE